jgi:hypothetical protein
VRSGRHGDVTWWSLNRLAFAYLDARRITVDGCEVSTDSQQVSSSLVDISPVPALSDAHAWTEYGRSVVLMGSVREVGVVHSLRNRRPACSRGGRAAPSSTSMEACRSFGSLDELPARQRLREHGPECVGDDDPARQWPCRAVE